MDSAEWAAATGGNGSPGVALGTTTAGLDSTVEYLQQLGVSGTQIVRFKAEILGRSQIWM